MSATLPLSAPLLQSGREVDELLAASGEECCVLERLLRCANSEAHEQMSLALWEAGAAEEAVSARTCN